MSDAQVSPKQTKSSKVATLKSSGSLTKVPKVKAKVEESPAQSKPTGY